MRGLLTAFSGRRLGLGWKPWLDSQIVSNMCAWWWWGLGGERALQDTLLRAATYSSLRNSLKPSGTSTQVQLDRWIHPRKEFQDKSLGNRASLLKDTFEGQGVLAGSMLAAQHEGDPGSLEHPVKPDGVGYFSNPSIPTVTWEAAAGESWKVLGQ